MAQDSIAIDSWWRAEQKARERGRRTGPFTDQRAFEGCVYSLVPLTGWRSGYLSLASLGSTSTSSAMTRRPVASSGSSRIGS